MIQVTSLSKEFSARLLFDDLTFSVNKNERIGLVGRNGSGKSTLLKIINKELTPDDGVISIPKNYSIEMLKQYIDFSKNTVLDECMQVLPKDQSLDFYKAEKILFGLGFEQEDLQKKPDSFSGGYQIRISLAKSLLKAPDMLLLDEPTNYLDIVSMRWLENFLRRYPGEIILITHDREFMTKVCTHTMGIHRNKLIKVQGDCEKYWSKIQEEETVYESTRLNNEKKKKDLERFISKFRAKARQASLAQSRQKMLDKMEEFDKLESISSIKFNFNYKDFSAKTFLHAQNISFGYTADLLFENLSFYLNKGDKIAIIGKNGKGKSTLLNIVANKFKPKTGTLQIHNNVSAGHFGQTNIETLHANNTIEEEIQAENTDLSKTQVRNICGSMMFSGEDAEKQIKVLSGGEKSRVLLGKILARKTNMLLLDEPTNHLDQESIEVLIKELKEFAGAVMIVTHNERILRRLANKFIVFHKGICELFEGSYDDFLDKVGWDEPDANQKKSKEKLSHKDYKQFRSDLIKQRAKETKGLKKEICELEESITLEEANVESANKMLIEASEKENASMIKDASQKLVQAQGKIELYFEKLEKASEKLETLESIFENKLSDLENKK